MNLLQRLRLGLARRRCNFALQRRLLIHPPPGRSARVCELNLVAIHFETTGRDPARDRVQAAGWMLIRGGRLVLASAREASMRPAGHGVDPQGEECGTQASVAALIESLLPELAGRVIVAHAAAIQRGFLNGLLRHLGGVPMPNPFVDTLALERRLIEGEGGIVREQFGDLTLEACRARRGLPAYQLRSAGAVALACAELLLAQLIRLGGVDHVRLRELR
jgi:DNA polymerase III subunit epsilon